MDTSPPQLFTVGYQGRSIGDYVQLLVRHRISLLCDVRKDPVSRKPGFSKRGMEKALANRNIQYQHYPGLGVPKPVRDKVKQRKDYRWLSQWYQEEVIEKHPDLLKQLYQQLESHQRIALTCYERDVRQCHRLFVVRAMQEQWLDRVAIKHL